jgi:predicted ABC-class ATPase
VEARLTVGLPARGRRIAGRAAATMLTGALPEVAAALQASALDAGAVWRHVAAVEDAAHLRRQLPGLDLVAFLADGAVLPRRSGVDQRPLPADAAIPLQAPASLRVAVDLPHAGRIEGLGIPRGVTLIVGGGYHGKSTLLRAIERGVYDHVPGDGRELVVTDPAAVKIRAEDGRRVEAVDISPFIGELPGGRATTAFRSDDASGSTSQAAAIVEALEAGATALLMDEDTSATNILIRDARMQALVAPEHEPITPFVDRVRQLFAARGVSTVLVLGGSGDYLDVADTVIAMREFVPHEVTATARQVAADHPTRRRDEAPEPPAAPAPRYPEASSLDPGRGRHAVKVTARGVRALQFGRQEIDLGALEQLVHPGQTRAIGAALVLVRDLCARDGLSVSAALAAVADRLEAGGLDVLAHREPPGDLARFRPLELAGALNRLRGLRVR